MSTFNGFPKPILDRYHHTVADKKLGSALKSAVKQITARGYLIDGKHYKKVPVDKWI